MKLFVVASFLVASVVAFPSYHHNEHAPLGHDGRVVDTAEVSHAKAEHFAAVAKAGGYATGHDHSDDHYAAHEYKNEDHSDFHYDGKYGYHYPTIKNGVPVDTVEVQHARAAHLAKLHAGGQGYADSYDYQHSEGPKETPEVQHLRAAHAAAHAEANARLHHHHKRSADHYHVPVIHNGVPVETPEVQHAKAAHAAAHAAASTHGHYDAGHYDEHHDEHQHNNHHHEDKKYDGKYGYHYPTIKNGVPVDTEEVQHARAAHLAKMFAAGHPATPEHHDDHHNYHHEPAIHNGVPVDTPEVQHAKAAHFAAVAEAKAQHAGHSYEHHEDGQWEEKKHW